MKNDELCQPIAMDGTYLIQSPKKQLKRNKKIMRHNWMFDNMKEFLLK